MDSIRRVSTIFYLVILCFSCATTARNKAFTKINQLKEGVLLVRLSSADNQIKRLKQVNKEKEARRLALKIQGKNKLIATEFKERFNFSEVYFFYPRAINESEFEQTKLLDSDLQSIGTVADLGKKYLIAYFGNGYENTITYTNQRDQERKVGGTYGFPALVIADENFVPLPKPFPTQLKVAKDENIGVAVRILNYRLKEFYSRAEKRKRRKSIAID